MTWATWAVHSNPLISGEPGLLFISESRLKCSASVAPTASCIANLKWNKTMFELTYLRDEWVRTFSPQIRHKCSLRMWMMSSNLTWKANLRQRRRSWSKLGMHTTSPGECTRGPLHNKLHLGSSGHILAPNRNSMNSERCRALFVQHGQRRSVMLSWCSWLLFGLEIELLTKKLFNVWLQDPHCKCLSILSILKHLKAS